MNTRIIDLIKNPEAIQLQDLDLLQKEIKKSPYIQHIRALHLYGVHQLQPENYQKALSVTAAYTTDKKILYQFINKKTLPVKSENESVEIPQEITPPPKIENYIRVDETELEVPKPVIIDGVLNRILFEGEEDFWETDHEVIDLESTIESGILTKQKLPNRISEEEIDKEVVPIQVVNNFEKSDEEVLHDTDLTPDFTSEVIIKGENIEEEKKVILNSEEKSFHEIPEFDPQESQSEAQKEIDAKDERTEEKIGPEEADLKKEIEAEALEDSSQISFHATQEFLPEVKIEPSRTEIRKAPPTASKISKHEEEMQRLIAEVEAKMKSSKKEKAAKPTQEITTNTDVNFSETQTFELEKVEEEEEEEEEKSELIEKSSNSTNQPEERTFRRGQSKRDVFETDESTWKPMNFAGEKQTKVVEPVKEMVEPINSENSSSENKEERPALNVSFFAPDVTATPSKPESELKSIAKNEEVQPKEKLVEENISPVKKDIDRDSNFPKFLNTWQNWLKIDRKEGKSEIIVEEVIPTKETVIEKFIQKEPRISKLKEESEFVVKERDGNISHLMTETLAQLYTNQKLFSKAIKAYQLLADKHPAKKEYFHDKILEVKELRKNP
ncbi:hypothetical protein [Chryseobacterium sp. MP_3.2]|uniref:hypothetical protein n=1 Tax=Chryseobacterium sp. MP_3.2 TaxID=3071712 RepID=UPI002E090806|nr:hypothetical protein [Chryseobacterium sp. MP_3.2]